MKDIWYVIREMFRDPAFKLGTIMMINACIYWLITETYNAAFAKFVQEEITKLMYVVAFPVFIVCNFKKRKDEKNERRRRR